MTFEEIYQLNEASPYKYHINGSKTQPELMFESFDIIYNTNKLQESVSDEDQKTAIDMAEKGQNGDAISFLVAKGVEYDKAKDFVFYHTKSKNMMLPRGIRQVLMNKPGLDSKYGEYRAGPLDRMMGFGKSDIRGFDPDDETYNPATAFQGGADELKQDIWVLYKEGNTPEEIADQIMSDKYYQKYMKGSKDDLIKFIKAWTANRADFHRNRAEDYYNEEKYIGDLPKIMNED